MRVLEPMLVGFVLVSLAVSGAFSMSLFSSSLPGSLPSDQLRAGVSSVVTGKVLVIAMDKPIERMNAAYTASMYGPPSLIYETLITRDKSGAYVPGLAESWEMKNMSGTGYPHNAVFNITLEQGVMFHDGSRFDSNAVKRIISYYAQNDSWMMYVFWSVYGVFDKVGWPDAGIWCTDDYHLTINLTRPDASLVFNLSNLYSSMMSPDALESDGITDYGTPGHKVVGTGPYVLTEWVANDHVTLTKNKNYTWGASWYVNKGPAKIDKIIYRIIPDQASRFAAFESGAVQVLQQVPPNKAWGYESLPSLSVITGPGQGTYHIDFNCMKAPWDNISLRKAFGYAIDRASILSTVWHGIGEEGVNYLSPIELESRNVPSQFNFSHDLARSEQLFLEAGWQDLDSDDWLENLTGDELSLDLWTTNNGEEVAMSELIRDQFISIGVHCSLTQYQENVLRDKAANGEHEAILMWYSWPRVDILDWQFGTWSMGASNLAWFSDPVFDGYVVNWTMAGTDKEFSDNATASHIRLLTQSPRIPILFWHQIDAVHGNVTGWYTNPIGMEQVFDILDVDVITPPQAMLVLTPDPAQVGEAVTFDALGSSDDVGIVNWTWSFMDGTRPVELWDEVGSYAFSEGAQTVDVTLTVRDGDGNTDTATVTLSVIQVVPEFQSVLVPVVGTIAALAMVGIFRRRSMQLSEK